MGINRNNIRIINCKTVKEASRKALDILVQTIDAGTLLLLSGGSSPNLLYKLIPKDKMLKPGAVGLIDERYGFPMHDNSNEKMISNTGLLKYLNDEGVPVYQILKENNIEKVTEQYEQTMKELFAGFSKKVAIMGIGTDGHTAGIKPDLDYDHSRMVVAYDAGSFGKRITLTFEALAKIDEFIILAFGENKKVALQKMFEEKDERLIPAAFYVGSSAKITLLTDIKIDL